MGEKIELIAVSGLNANVVKHSETYNKIAGEISEIDTKHAEEKNNKRQYEIAKGIVDVMKQRNAQVLDKVTFGLNKKGKEEMIKQQKENKEEIELNKE